MDLNAGLSMTITTDTRGDLSMTVCEGSKVVLDAKVSMPHGATLADYAMGLLVIADELAAKKDLRKS